MAEDIRISVGADTTQMESQIANAARKATVVIRPTIDSKGLEKISAPLGRITGQADEFSKSMEAANARVLAFGASVGVLNAVAKSFQNIVTASTQVEASLKEIQVATGETSGNLEKLGKGIFEVARSTGLSFKQASEATLEFARQGGTLEDSLMKAKAALVLTRTTGLDAAEAVKGLTAAVLSFNQVGLDYETVVNKLAAVDTKFAVSSRDLIEGISRSASVAQEAGVSFDELTALITTLQEKTARGGAVIGNALKTIFQRVQTTENLDYIRNLGIAVNDVSGDILPATTIIKKLADEFQNLDSATRKGLLIKIGGGFQIDKLAALLNDISSANGTFNRSLEQSSNAGNQGFRKLEELNKTVQASFDRLTTSGTEFAATVGKIAFSDDFRSILNKTSSFLESLNESISGGEEGGATIGKSIVKGIGSIITGPGALLLAGLGIKLFGDLAKFGVDSLKNQLGVTNVKKEQQDIEKSILGLLLQNTAVQSKIVSLEGNKAAQAEYLLGLYSKQAATLERMSKLSKDIGPSVYEGGIRLSTEGTKNVKSKSAAGGYMSKDAARKMEMQEAPAGASIREISNFNFGPTEGKGTMIVNSMESVHKTPMGDFVVPSYSKTRTGKPTLFSASGYVPNFAEEKQKENLLKNLNIDGGAYSFAGLTIGGTGSKAVRAKEVTPQILSQIKDPVLSEALSKYSKLNFSNVSVGNIYRRRDENLDSLQASEKDIKDHFVKKANSALSPQIGTFIKDELSSLGIKPTATMQYLMKNGRKFDFVNDSMAGTFFETMLKMANMSAEDDNFGQFFNDSNSRFDIYGLKPDIAEQYGLPKKFWEYVEIKSSEKALNDEIGTKFIQQLSQAGGESLKSKFLAQAKTGAEGYVPNFAIKGLASNVEVLAGRVFEALLRGDEYLSLTENDVLPDITRGEYSRGEAKMSVNAALRDPNFGEGKGKGNVVIVPKDSSKEKDELLKKKKKSIIRRPEENKFLRGNVFKIARETLEAESKNKNTNYNKIKMATAAAEGYVPNFAGTTNFEGSASRYGKSIARVYDQGEEALKATLNNPKTAFSGTLTGKRGFGDDFEKYGYIDVDENGIIASILGNNTFVAGKDQRRALESLAIRLTAQNATIKGSDMNFAGLSVQRLAVNPYQAMTADVKGKFKNIEYEKLKKILPRFWKAKGLGSAWEKAKLFAAYKTEDAWRAKITQNLPELEEFFNNKDAVRKNNELLRNSAVESVLKKDPSIAGFLVDIKGSGDEQYLKQQGFGDKGIKYAMPFSGASLSNVENAGLKEEQYKLRKEYQQKGVFYGDFLAEKEKYLKFGKNWKYASGRKFLQPDGTKTASQGYIPNFSKEAVLDAIGREQKESGLPLSAIKVVQDARVRGAQNPDGYAVINNRDEPDGRVPNFSAPSGGLNPDLTKAIEDALNGLKNSSLSLDDAFKRIAENLGVSGEAINQVFDRMTSSGSAAAESTQKAAESGKKEAEQGNKDAQNKKNAGEKEVKTTQDTLYNLIKFQTVLSFATGAISSFGKSGEQIAEILSSASQSLYLFSQAKELGGTIAGEGGISGGFKAGAEAAKAAKESGGSQVGAFIKGGGGMAALGTLATGAGYAVAAYEGIKALDAGMQIWNGTVAKSEKFIEDLTTASEKYNIQLSEQQKRVVSRISEKAAGGTDIGSQVSIGLSKFFNTEEFKTFGDLKGLVNETKLSTDAQKTLLEKLGNVIAPQATQQLTTDGNPNPTTGEVQLKTIQILTDKLKEFEGKSFESTTLTKERSLANLDARYSKASTTEEMIGLSSEYAQVEKRYNEIAKIQKELNLLEDLRNSKLDLTNKAKEKLKNLSEKEVDLQERLKSLQGENVEKIFDAVKYQKLITEYIKEQVAPAQQAAYAEATRQEAMLVSANLLKEELDIQTKLKQLELNRITPRENMLSIEKDLLSTTEARRASIDLELKQLEEQRKLQSEIKTITTTKGRETLDKYLSFTGTGLTEGRKTELNTGFQEIIDAGSIKESEDAIRKFNGLLSVTKKTSQEQTQEIQKQVDNYKRQIVDLADLQDADDGRLETAKQGLIEEQKKLETIGASNVVLESMLRIMGQQIDYAKKATAERLRQNAQDTLNASIVKQQNFYINATKDVLNAQLTIKDQALQKEKERLGYLREIQDAEIGIARIGKDTPKDRYNQALQDVQTELSRRKENAAQTQQQTFLTNQRNVVQQLSQKPETMQYAEKALNAKTEKDLLDAVRESLNIEETSFESTVVKAAKDFHDIITGTAKELKGESPNLQKKALRSASRASETTSLNTETRISEIQKAEYEYENLNIQIDAKNKEIENLQGKIYKENPPEGSGELKKLNQELDDLVSKQNKVDDLIASLAAFPDALAVKKGKENIDLLNTNDRLLAAKTGIVLTPPVEEDKKAAQRTADRKNAEIQFAERSRVEFGLGMKQSFDTINTDVEQFGNTLGKQIPMNFRDGLVDAMKALSDPNATNSLKERLMGVASAFLNKINDALMTNTANQITSGIGSLFKQGGQGFASGGPIKGGSGTKDDVPAMLMGGEYVIKKNAVNKYGKDFFDKLNSGKMKGFASGGLVETDLNDLIKNPTKYTPYGETRMNGLSFDESGKVIGMQDYKGTEENKQDALSKAQTNFYSKQQQSGQGGFFMPGTYGQGAIMGQKNLLAYATQQTTGTQYDKISSSGGAASIDLAAGSGNLSLFALRDQGNVRNAQYLESKNKALDLYFGGIQASKDKIKMDYDNQKQYEAQKKAYEDAKKQARKAMLMQIGTTVAMAGISALGNAAMSGKTAAQQAFASGQSGAEKPGFFTGMWSGAKINGETFGGMGNALKFDSNAFKTADLLGAKGGALSWNARDQSYQPLTTNEYNAIAPMGASWSKGSVGTPYSWQRKAAGGFVAGNGMGDNVPAMLNGGEFVVSKQAAQKTGYGNLQKLNSTGATGGDSSEMTARIESKLEELVEKIAGVGTINISVNSDGKGGEKESQSDSKQDQQNKELARRIKEVVLSVLRDEKRLGGMLR